VLKKRLLRLVALLLGVMLAFALVGCEDSAGGENTWGGGNQPGGNGGKTGSGGGEIGGTNFIFSGHL